jgi:hypothetical protein
MFNLYVTVDPLDETNLIIEKRDTYYNGGTIRDWSHKLAKDQPVIVKPLGLLTAKEYIYRTRMTVTTITNALKICAVIITGVHVLK